MTTRDEVREVLRTLPDDYLRRYVNAYEARKLSCFPDVMYNKCAITVMAGVNLYCHAEDRLTREGFEFRTIESFYENFCGLNAVGGPNATPLYDECVMELARRADVPAAVGV